MKRKEREGGWRDSEKQKRERRGREGGKEGGKERGRKGGREGGREGRRRKRERQRRDVSAQRHRRCLAAVVLMCSGSEHLMNR